MGLAELRGIGIVPAGGPAWASARYRAHAPVRILAARGLEIEITSLERAAARSVAVLQKRYDDEALEFAVEHRRRGGLVVLDLCDHDLWAPLFRRRRAWREKAARLRRMLDAVDRVTTATPALARELRRWRADPLPDLIEGIEPRRFAAPSARPRIAWFGNAGSRRPRHGLIDLQRLVRPLDALWPDLDLELLVISSKRDLADRYLGRAAFPWRFVPWTLATFHDELARCDVTALPISRNPFTRSKTSNRPYTSLSLGVPVVADRIPSYDEFEGCMRFGDLAAGVRAYLADPDEARRHVEEAQRRIAGPLSAESLADEWEAYFVALTMEPRNVEILSKRAI